MSEENIPHFSFYIDFLKTKGYKITKIGTNYMLHPSPVTLENDMLTKRELIMFACGYKLGLYEERHS